LRPTPDRVRETLFNWLGQDLSGLACLDLFAGSGALGFEAASRGAAKVVMVDQSPQLRWRHSKPTRETRRRCASADCAFGCGKIRLLAGSRFDVLFLDPPFHQGWIEKLVTDRARGAGCRRQ
jgi:16S rRNA (guanine966-N2)-methyltransferase